MFKSLFITLVLSVWVTAFLPAQITGKVYLDANGNGKCDPGEKGMTGVCIQDGLNVVMTEDDGTFRLPGHENVRFISLTPPDGYQSSPAHYVAYAGPKKQYHLGLVQAPVYTAGTDRKSVV